MFKDYIQNPISSIPIKIEEESEVSLINIVVEWLNLEDLLSNHKIKWQKSYNPVWLLKILIYAYLKWIRSSNVIHELCIKHTDYRFLIWTKIPSARKIRDFRLVNTNNIKWYFVEVLKICSELWLTKLWEINIDWSKFKANVSSKQTKTEEAIEKELMRLQEKEIKLKEEIEIIFNEVETEEQREENNTIKKVLSNTKVGLSEDRIKVIESQKILETIKNRKIKLENSKKEMKKRWLEKINITDNNAKFMKTSEWKIKPAYNVQVSSNNQVIQDYEVTDRPTDINDYQSMVEWTERNTWIKTKKTNADAWYSSEENLEYNEEKNIDWRIPDTKYYRSKKWELEKFDKDNFNYNKEKDIYLCPNKKELINKWERKDWDKIKLRYQSNKEDCEKCIDKKECLKSRLWKTKELFVAKRYEELKSNMREKLNKEPEEYQKRMYDVEPIFWNIKHNMWFRNFSMHWFSWVKKEMWFMALAHNLKKLYKYVEKKWNFSSIGELCLKNTRSPKLRIG